MPVTTTGLELGMKHLLLLIALFSSPVFAGNVNIDNLDPGKDVVIRTTNSAGVKQEVGRFSPPLGNGVRSVGTVGSAPQLATYSALVAADFPGAASLSYFWSLNADGNDGSANAKHLSTTVGSPSFTGVGFYGNESIVTFKPGDALRRLSDTVFNLNLATATVTYGGWAFLPSTCFGSGGVLLEQSSVIGTILQCGGAGFRACNTSGSICVTTNGYSGLADSWHHYVLSINAGTLRLYVDGQLSGSNTGLTGTGSGADFRVGDTVLQGRMQQVFYTAQVLTESQINGIYSKRFKGGQPQIAAGHTLAASSFPLTSLTGKVAYWNLQADATDGSGNGKNLLNANTAQACTTGGTMAFTGSGLTGVANDAPVFVGTTNSFCSTDSFFNPGNGHSFAVGGWLAADNWNAASEKTIAQQYFADASDRGWVLKYTQTGTISFNTTNTAGSWDSQLNISGATTGFGNGSWHHIVAMFDYQNQVNKVYIDGNLSGSITATNVRATATPTFRLGAWNSATAPATAWNGRMNQMFYMKDVQLTDADIRKLYSARATHNKAIPKEQQFWQASWLREDGKLSLPLENGWITDMGTNDLFMDFSDLNSGDQIFLRSK